jgi:hypothetical protein
MKMAVTYFAYNRPEHFENSLKSAVSELGGKGLHWVIYIDGPKLKDSIQKQDKIKQICKKYLYDEIFQTKLRPTNLGLCNNVIHGLTETLEEYDYSIVLEDDLELLPGAYDFIISSINKYDFSQIYQLSLFSYFSSKNKDCFLLPVSTSWGWVINKQRWMQFVEFISDNFDAGKILKSQTEFDMNNSYPFSKMLKMQLLGKRSSWAILFYSFVFVNKGACLYPPVSFINNNGFDGSGTHGSFGVDGMYGNPGAVTDVFFPEPIVLHTENVLKLRESLSQKSFFRRALNYATKKVFK